MNITKVNNVSTRYMNNAEILNHLTDLLKKRETLKVEVNDKPFQISDAHIAAIRTWIPQEVA